MLKLDLLISFVAANTSVLSLKFNNKPDKELKDPVRTATMALAASHS